MKRRLARALGLVVIAALSVWSARAMPVRALPIKVGPLRSRTGSLAVSEQTLINAELLFEPWGRTWANPATEGRP